MILQKPVLNNSLIISPPRLPIPIQARFTFSERPIFRGFGFFAERLSNDKPDNAVVAVITDNWRRKLRRDDFELNSIA